MLKNHLKIAWRNLKKNKGYSIINIGGLAVGIAVVMMIGLWIYDEVTFNTDHDNYKDIAQVMVHKTSNGDMRTRSILPYPIGDELRNTYGSDFKYIVMSSGRGDHILSVGEKNSTRHGAYMEADVLRMLSLQMLRGTENGLAEPNSIVISKATANAYFGDAEPVGQHMQINNALNVLVTGVFDDLPYNSEFRGLQFIAPWKLYVSSTDWVREARDRNLWDNNSYQLYVQVSEKSEMGVVSDKIKSIIYNNLSEVGKRSNPELFLHPMKDWHLKSSWKNGVQTDGLMQYVWLFGIIGLFVLLLACINFMNLSTAQSEKRAKEVGVRKTVGSSKHQLIVQFFIESVLVTFFAFLVAVSLVLTLIPYFNVLADKAIVFPIANLAFWLICLGLIFITAVLAGSYPALYLSSFKPVKVLKGTIKSGRSALSFRKVLVIGQFTISLVLIIGTLVIRDQIEHSKDRPVGYEKSQLVMIEKTTEDYEGKYNLLREALIQERVVDEMSESSSPLTEVWNSTGGFDWEGKDPEFDTNMITFFVSHDYGKTVGWELIKGRGFSREFATDSTAFVLNEAAVAYMGLENPVGKTIRWAGQEHEVIGVVKNMVTESPFEPVRQAIYLIDYTNTNWIELRLSPSKSITQSLAQIETVFQKYVPNVPFQYQFVDEAFAGKFKAEERIRHLSGIFAFLAIFICCLGLFGLASFVAEQRTKEIGVRKVLGASVLSVWKLLSKDFVVLVLISCLIAVPVAYHFMNRWLQNYEYRIEISWWVFGLAVVGALVVALLTVSFQALKAAFVDPVKSLRSE